jgi:hypothetical protein
MQWSSTEVHRNFGVTFYFYFEGKMVRQTRNQNEAIGKPVSCVAQYSILKMEPIYAIRNVWLSPNYAAL